MINKLFEKIISRLPPWCLFLCLPFLLRFIGFIDDSLKKSSNLSRNWQIFIVMSLFTVFLFAFLFVLRKFRKAQQIWLQQHGYKAYAKKYLYELMLPYYQRALFYTYKIFCVEGLIEGKTRRFWSDWYKQSSRSWAKNLFKGGLVSKNGYTKSVTEKDIEAYIKNHPEGLEVFISPDNPHVYWVNTTTLKDARLGLDFSNS